MNKPRYDLGTEVTVLTPEMQRDGLEEQSGVIDGVFVEEGICTRRRVLRVRVDGHHVYAYTTMLDFKIA